MSNTVVEIKEMVSIFVSNYDAIKTLVSFGRFNKNLDQEEIARIFNELDEQADKIKNTIFSGTEDVSKVSAICNGHLKTIKKLLNGDLVSPIAEEVSELKFQLSLWEKVMSLGIPYGTLIYEEEEKSSREKRKVELKLESCAALKAKLDAMISSRYASIAKCNAEIAELKRKLASTTDELMMVRFDTAIIDLEDKKVLENNFALRLNDCSRLLDRIGLLCKNFLESGNEYSKFFKLVKASLDIDNFQNIVGDPNKAVAILGVLEKELQELTKNLVVRRTEASNANSEAIERAKRHRAEILEAQAALEAAKDTQDIENKVNPSVEAPADSKIKLGDK